ncbi:unnamed protein product [Closterium sp. Naga37s-1]|nr:unnamed protein product [Closterium sp. Naga37s-1]
MGEGSYGVSHNACSCYIFPCVKTQPLPSRKGENGGRRRCRFKRGLTDGEAGGGGADGVSGEKGGLCVNVPQGGEEGGLCVNVPQGGEEGGLCVNVPQGGEEGGLCVNVPHGGAAEEERGDSWAGGEKVLC